MIGEHYPHLLKDLACLRRLLGEKVRAKVLLLAFGGFPSEFFDFFGEFLVGYQFPLYLYLTYEVFKFLVNI